MPNYGLVVTPQYNPMSYEQYIQPFKEYAQVYNATVDQIDALEMEANQWERLADSDIGYSSTVNLACKNTDIIICTKQSACSDIGIDESNIADCCTLTDFVEHT